MRSRGNRGERLGPDNLFIHMTGMSDAGWNGVRNSGAHVSIAFPIEMHMRHGMPPIVTMQQLGLEASLSTDVETNMTADFFTQMRSAMTMQRMIINQAVLDTGDFVTFPTGTWPTFPAGLPPLLNARDVLRFATINGAKHLRLDGAPSPGELAEERDVERGEGRSNRPGDRVDGGGRRPQPSHIAPALRSGLGSRLSPLCMTTVPNGCETPTGGDAPRGQHTDGYERGL